MKGRRGLVSLLVAAAVAVAVAITASCSSAPTDLRKMLPAGSLVYLETQDLAAAVESVTLNPQFAKLAASTPDTRRLKGVRVAVAVTGVETAAEPADDEKAFVKFRPKFVAAIDTNAWNFQAEKFVENYLSGLIDRSLGGGSTLERSARFGGEVFTWSGGDGRKAYSLVRDRVVFVSNDEVSLEAAVQAADGSAAAASSDLQIAALPRDVLAAGYVSAAGVAQLSSVAGLSFAMDMGGGDTEKGFAARVVPDLVKNSVTGVTWTARGASNGRTEDTFALTLAGDLPRVLSGSIKPSPVADPELDSLLPHEFASVTRYDLADPQIAWRSILLSARTRTDDAAGALLAEFAPSMFERFGVRDAEVFLSGVAENIRTVRFDEDGTQTAAMVRMKDVDAVNRSLFPAIAPRSGPGAAAETNGFAMRFDAEDELASAVRANILIIGDAEAVRRWVPSVRADAASGTGEAPADPIVTVGVASDPEAEAVAAIAGRKDVSPLVTTYATRTRFTAGGVERVTTSDLGMLGTLLAQAVSSAK